MEVQVFASLAVLQAAFGEGHRLLQTLTRLQVAHAQFQEQRDLRAQVPLDWFLERVERDSVNA